MVRLLKRKKATPTPRPTETPADQPVLSVHVGDLHVGSTLALMPPVVELDDGGEYCASKVQLWYWECWQRFWEETAQLKEKYGARCVGIFGGDEREGDHHNTTQIWAKSTADQDQAALQVLEVAGGVLDEAVFVRGTPAHAGPASAATESYARALARRGWKIRKNWIGHWSYWHYTAVWSGVRFDVAHAPGTKSWVPHTRDAAAARHAQYTWEEYHQEGIDPPDIIVRHHIHHKAQGYYQDTACFFIPSWQLPTNWVKSRGVKSPRIDRPGGLRILCEEGTWRPFWKLYRPRSTVAWSR
jgi:hypothetical protein